MTTIQIGLWCNGNTTDSGPVIPGSNPGSPTKGPLEKEVLFFCFISSLISGIGSIGIIGVISVIKIL